MNWDKLEEEKAKKEAVLDEQCQKFEAEYEGGKKCPKEHALKFQSRLWKTAKLRCGKCKKDTEVRGGVAVCHDCNYVECYWCCQGTERPDNRDKTTNLKCNKGHELGFFEDLSKESNGVYGSNNGGSYRCDLCSKHGYAMDGVFHCGECAYDVCLKCNDKAKKSDEKKSEAPKTEETVQKKEAEEEVVEHKDGPLLKITFMSGDRSVESYNEYFATMPWTSNGYDKPAYSKRMSDFGLSGIPSLVVLNKDGKTAASKVGRGHVGKGPLECMKHWIGLL